MNKILIVTHGNFGVELKKSAEMIIGKQDDVDALGLAPGQSVDEFRATVMDVVERQRAAGARTVIMCDLMGGSPSNIALACVGRADCDVLLGVNMPMLIEAIQNLDLAGGGHELAMRSLESARQGTRLINRTNLKN